MNTYINTKNSIGFDINHMEGWYSWVRFDRLDDGTVRIDRAGEPCLTEKNVAELVKWLTPKGRER